MLFKTPLLFKIIIGLSIFICYHSTFSRQIYWPCQSAYGNKYLPKNIIEHVLNDITTKYSYSSNLLLNPIVFYQKTLSRSSCQYFPSCSRYTYLSIKNYGHLKGLVMGAERLTRCFYNTDGTKYFRIGPFYYDTPRDLFQKRSCQQALSFEQFVINQFNLQINHDYNSGGLFESSFASNLSSQTSDSLLFLFKESKLRNSELNFAIFLYQTKQYYQAVTELNRYLFNNSNCDHANSLWLLIACCNFQAGRYHDSAKSFQQLSVNCSDKRKDIFSQYMAGLSYLNDGKYQNAKKTFAPLIKGNSKYFQRQLFFAYLASCFKTDDVKSVFELTSEKKNLHYLNNLHKNLKKIKKKSPGFAALLSAIVSGGEQFYSGHYREGIFSFIVNSTLGYLLYDSYFNGTTSNKIFHGILFLQFYSSNIIAGKRAAEIHNEMEMEKILTELQKTISVRFEFPIFRTEQKVYLIVE